jgi:hypothetical protein
LQLLTGFVSQCVCLCVCVCVWKVCSCWVSHEGSKSLRSGRAALFMTRYACVFYPLSPWPWTRCH